MTGGVLAAARRDCQAFNGGWPVPGGTQLAALEGMRPTSVRIDAGDVVVDGDLTVPPGARGVVAFAHGSGSGRQSPRNRMVAGALEGAGFATLLFDLLTMAEEVVDRETARLRFDIPLLARRLVAACDWLGRQPSVAALPLGSFGASTGAAAALIAAAARPAVVRAVVSRGGRPDLAGDALPAVRAATLLIVGADDAPVIELNRRALRQLRGRAELSIVAGASHLFAEPGTLEHVSRLACAWFEETLAERRAA